MEAIVGLLLYENEGKKRLRMMFVSSISVMLYLFGENGKCLEKKGSVGMKTLVLTSFGFILFVQLYLSVATSYFISSPEPQHLRSMAEVFDAG